MEDGLYELFGLLGGFAFAFSAVSDGLEDGFVHLDGVVTLWIGVVEWMYVFYKLFEHRSMNATVCDFFVYLNGCCEVAFLDFGCEGLALFVANHFFIVVFG